MKKTAFSKSFFLISTVIAVIVLCFFGKDTVFTWIGAGYTISEQKRQIHELELKNAELDRRIEAMSGNRDTLETYARETFHFTRHGDDVFLFDE